MNTTGIIGGIMKSAALVLALLSVGLTHAQTGSGGTLVAPTTLGHAITISNVAITDGSTADVTCPVTFFGAGTYQWNWECAGGSLVIDGAAVASVSGTMKLTCSGGGRTHKTTCWHAFSGTAVKADGASGAVSATSKGGTNNATSTVVSFSVAW